MEPATMSDVKELMKELRESITETVAEAFGNSKPALEHATTSNASQLLTMDASDAKVPTPACSSPDQGTSAFDPSPTATIYILSELDVDTTGVAAPTPVTCSTEWSPKQPIDVPVLVASSSLTLTEYGLDATPTSGATTTSMVSDVSVCVKSPSTWSLSQDATATMKEHKGTHEYVIPLSIIPSTWYEHLIVPRGPCSISLHVQMVFENHRSVINSELRPAWPPPVQINFSGLCSLGKFDTDATSYLFHWNPDGSLSCGLSNPARAILPNMPLQMSLTSLEQNLIWRTSAPSFLMTDNWNGGFVPVYLNLNADCTSFSCMIIQRSLLDLNRHTSLTYLRVVVSSTIGWCVILLSQHVQREHWLTSPWDSAQQADLFSCANRNTTCLPGYLVTGCQIQVTAACSTLHLFLGGFSPSFCLVVMLELQLARSGSQCVYLQKLQMDTCELEGATLNNISINGNRCWLKWLKCDLENRVYAGHAVLTHGLVLMCWLEEQLQSTWPPTITSCSVPNNMFRNVEFSTLVIWELWLLNHQDIIQFQIAWQHRFHACLVTI